MNYITASKLYDFLQCPHKVWRDIYGPEDEKIQETNPFIQLLWEKGVSHEEKIKTTLGEYLDLSQGSMDDRFNKTINAMKNRVPLIYQGVIRHDVLLGIPDLLKLQNNNTYIPIDIKSGMGFESASDEDNEEEGKPKKHYAVQLCLYVEILQKLGFNNRLSGKIIDITGKEVEYDLQSKMGPRTPTSFWEFYEQIKIQVQNLIENNTQNKPASAGICKLCPWYSSCKKWCIEKDDLTGIFCLGRSIRDKINEDLYIDKIEEFCTVNVEEIMKLKTKEIKEGNKQFLYRLGEDGLHKAIRRANILTKTKKPVAHGAINLPTVKYELFFDIEDDPTQEFVYLHGVYERVGKKERFLDFTATELTPSAEKDAWKKFWDYIRSLPENEFAVYYYSSHEKTTYKKLQKKYPDVISIEDLDRFFTNPNVIDLYTQVIYSQTDWPVGSYSLKTLATYLGFSWRDETPSGALSIQWFNEYLATNDSEILKRILEYNEDDCKATMVLKDALCRL